MTTTRTEEPAMQDQPIADVMHVGIFTADPGTSLAALATLMAERSIHCVIVEGIRAGAGGDHLVWGVVSDRDLVAALHAGSDADAGRLAGTEPLMVAEQARLSDAMALMVEHDVSHLVVVDERDGRPTGVLSTLDIARALAQDAAVGA